MPPIVRTLWRWSAALAATVVILLAVAVGLFRLFLPQLPEYRAQIETWAGQAIGRPLRIGAIDARLAFNGPRIVFRDTVVLSADGQSPVLDADSISVVINPIALVLEQKLSVSSVRVNGIVLDVERREDGRLEVLNRVFPPEPGPHDSAAMPVSFPDGRFEIRDATVRLIDARNPDRPLVFRKTQLDIDKDDEDFSLGLTLELPETLGREIRATLTTSSLGQDPAPGQWQLSVQADAVALQGWHAVLPEQWAGSLSGTGSSTLWASFGGGEISNFIVDLRFRDLALPDPDSTRPAVFERLEGSVEWQQQAEGWHLKISGLDVARDGRQWQAPTIRAELTGSQDSGRLVYVSADALDLEDVQPFLHRLPQGPMRERLLLLAPRGIVRGLNAQYSALPDKPASYSVSAELSEVGFNAEGSIPGLVHVSGMLRADEDGGQFELQSRDLGVDMPRVFERELVLEQARGQLSWKRNANGLNIQGKDLVMANADLYTYSVIDISIPEGDGAPVLNLESQVRNGQVAGKTKYLPIVKLPASVRDWLDRALVQGVIPEGRVVFRGPVNRFPFSEGGGQFLAEFSIQDLVLDYQEGWPGLTGINADVRFEGPGLGVKIKGGQIAGNEVLGGEAKIQRLAEGVLQVEGKVRGPATAGLGYLAAIPPGQGYRKAIDDLEVSGEAEIDLDLLLPLKEIEAHRLVLDMHITDGAVRPLGMEEGLKDVNGRVLLEQGTLHGNEISASYLGSPARVDVSPEPSVQDNPATLVLLRGWSEAQALAHQFFPPIEPYVDGRTDWFAVLRLPPLASGEPVSVSARTVLGGMQVNLPQPMRKSAQEVRLLELVYSMYSDERRGLVMALGEDMRASLDLRQDAQGWTVVSGDVVLGGGVPAREGKVGLHITGNTPFLRLDEWLALGDGQQVAEGPKLEDVLKGVDLRVDDFRAFGQALGSAELKLLNEGGNWDAEVNGENAVGRVRVPQDTVSESPTEMSFQKLVLIADRDAPASESDPREARPFILEVEDFALDDMRLGRLEAAATRAPLGLSVDRLQTRHPAFQINGAATWMLTAEGQMTGIKATLTSTDLLATYQSLGLGNLVRGKEGKIDADVYWQGQPEADLMASLSGQVRIEMKDGSIAEIEPGAGRALGLLSVAALPRRLALDFSDVFEEGLAFDRISGDFNLVNGNAYTSNLVMDGPSVGIGITGRTGLLAKDYDQTAIVHANIGSSLPIAGALAGGPGLGAALFIFSEVFKEPLKGISRARYRISGPWQDPVVERIDSSGLARGEQATSQDTAMDQDAGDPDGATGNEEDRP